MQNIVAFIPARGGSQSIQRKNLKLLGNKPLIAYSIEQALSLGLRTIVSTEDREIAEVARKYGAEVLDRPSSLAKHSTSTYELLKGEVDKIDPKPELILLLQPTSPLREKVHIKMAIDFLSANLDKYDSLVSVEKVPEKYNPAQVIISNGKEKGMIFRMPTIKEKLLSYFLGITYEPSMSGYPISKRMTHRQHFPEAWVPTGSIYLFKTSNLTKGSIYGDQVMLLETEGNININSEEDFKLCEESLLATEK